MEILEIKGNTFCLDTGMTNIPFYKLDQRRIIMLDTGWAAGERSLLKDFLQQNSFTVAGIINSHAHIDHCGNNAYLKEHFGCPVAMPAAEATICESLLNLKLYYSAFSLKEIREHLGHMICHVDCPVTTDRESVEMGGAVFKILHTPGHSIAHVCITTPDDVAYVGDALISHGVMRGAKMPYACVLSEDLKSKEKLRGLACSRYIAAHRGIYDNILELVEDNIEFYKLRAEKILALLVRPMTLQELAQETVANFHIGMGSVFKYNLIERMLRSYLEYLTETGRIALSVNDSVLRYTRL